MVFAKYIRPILNLDPTEMILSIGFDMSRGFLIWIASIISGVINEEAAKKDRVFFLKI